MHKAGYVAGGDCSIPDVRVRGGHPDLPEQEDSAWLMIRHLVGIQPVDL